MPDLYDEAPWDLLARHLRADLDGAGQTQLRGWLQADARHLEVLVTLTRVWELTAPARPPLFTAAEVAAAWQRFRPLMVAGASTSAPAAAAAEPTSSPPAPLPPAPCLAVTQRRQRRRWAVPLLLTLLLVGAGWAWTLTRRSALARPEAASFVSADGARLVTLPDSSRAWLNARSTLRYASAGGVNGAVGAATRRVQLTGEAYFEVRALGANRPFVVSTTTAQVRVVGTAFNVRAYAAEDSMEVSVRHGRVWLTPLAGPDSVLLTAGTRAALRAADAPGRAAGPLRRLPIPNQNFRAWQTDTLRFADAPLPQVLRALQATYGTRVALAAPGLSACRFTGTFVHPRPAQVLAVVAVATGCRLRPDAGGGYVLSGAGCAGGSQAAASGR